MLRNYLKVAFRNVKRYKAHSFINIVGLATGLACCMLIFLYVSFELSYDRFHDDHHLVYRVASDMQTGDRLDEWACSAEPLGPTLRENFPDAGTVARIQELGRPVVEREGVLSYEPGLIVADPQLLEVLTIPFLEGTPSGALDQPGTIVVTESFSRKHSLGSEALGRTLRINNQDFRITGVIVDPPINSHLKYSGVLSFKTIEPHENMFNWLRMSTYTYMRLDPQTDPTVLEEDINRIVGAIAKEASSRAPDIKLEFVMQPMVAIHLQSNRWGEFEAPGSMSYVLVFSCIGLLVLAIAIANFMNLSTARSACRGKEVGMRRVAGASRGQLALQFFGEAGLLTGLSLLLACLIAELVLPLANDITGLQLTLGTFAKPLTIASIIAFGLVVSLVSGSYPSVIFSGIKPVSVLRGDMVAGPKGVAMRRILVVGQFAASILLILATMTIYGQLDHMKNRPLGFDAEQKLILPIPEHVSIAGNYEAVKSEFLSHPTIIGASALSLTPGRMNKIHGFSVPDASKEKQFLYHVHADYDFISEYGIELAAGRNFSREIGSDLLEAGIINQAAARKFGWSSPDIAIGKTVVGPSDNRMTIVGVTKDFHFRGLQDAIQPLYIELDPGQFHNISLTFSSADFRESLSFVERKWQELFPSSPFEHYFLDTDFDRHYRGEERIGGIVGSFGLLGIGVACLGLFGLAAFSAEQRTKEIGIRKVLGASVAGIVRLLTREFVVLVGIANVIAWPIAYFAMNHWLQDFAYRIELGIGTFVLAGLAAMVIAMLTVSYQALKAARANPVEALKYE